jgi:hypothetical protein
VRRRQIVGDHEQQIAGRRLRSRVPVADGGDTRRRWVDDAAEPTGRGNGDLIVLIEREDVLDTGWPESSTEPLLSNTNRSLACSVRRVEERDDEVSRDVARAHCTRNAIASPVGSVSGTQSGRTCRAVHIE